MTERPTEHEGRRALREHIGARAAEAHSRYGPRVDTQAVLSMLADRSVVRFPVEVRFGTGALEPGEPGYPMALGGRPGAGYRLWLDPSLESRPELLAPVIAYYIPTINYGEIITREEAELFGATLLGLETDTYYQTMCEIADSLPSAAARAGDGDS